MTPYTAQQTGRKEEIAFSVSGVFKARTSLLDRLAEIVASLGLAKLELRSALESRDAARYQSAEFEVERLRRDWTSTVAKLEYYKARHGDGPEVEEGTGSAIGVI